MNQQESTNHEFEPRPSDLGDELDELLRKADWPSPPPAALERLEQRWRQLSPSARRTPRTWAYVAAAAAIMAVAVGLSLIHQKSVGPPTEIVSGQPQTGAGETSTTLRNKTTNRPSRNAAVTPGNVLPGNVLPGSVLPGQAKRPVESGPRSSFDGVKRPESGAGGTRSQEPVTTPRPRTQPQWIAHFRQLDRQLLATINQTAGEFDISAAEFDKLPPGDRAYCVQRLPTMIVSSDGGQQVAAIDLLEQLAGEASVPTLIRLVTVPTCHEQIVRRLAPKVDTATLQSWISAESSYVLQRDMLTTLIGRGDEYSVASFLNLVVSRKTRRTALEALRETQNPPSRIMLGFFSHPNADLRKAAVLAVAESNDPSVVDPLIGMVTTNFHRLEALMTLMKRDDFRSTQFVYQVAHYEAYSGAFLSAQNELRNSVD